MTATNSKSFNEKKINKYKRENEKRRDMKGFGFLPDFRNSPCSLHEAIRLIAKQFFARHLNLPRL
jgi:hypothetical protein